MPVCWGCGGQHSWWNAISKSINCPSKDNPKIQANAAAAFDAHKQKKKAKAQPYKKKRKIHTLVSSLMADNYSDDDQSETKQKIAQAIVATLSPTKFPKIKAKFEPVFKSNDENPTSIRFMKYSNSGCQ